MAQAAQGWTPVAESSGWTPVEEVATPTAAQMLSGAVGRETNLQEGPPPPPTWKTQLGEALQHAAQPQTVGDLASLALYDVPPAALQTLKLSGAMLRAGAAGAKESPTVFKMPGYFLRGMSRYVNTEPVAAHEVTRLLSGGPATVREATPDLFDQVRAARAAELRPVPAHAQTESAAPGALSVADRASLVKQGYTPDVIARIEGRLADQGVAPVASHPQPANPLAQPRLERGAQVVGRELGMTKDDVRQAAGPVLDEARGEASPIFPKNVLTKIIDDIRQLPPGAEREAYVARATSGKAKWQVENIRRTLEHLGLVVPAAVSARDLVLQRMRAMASREPSEPQ